MLEILAYSILLMYEQLNQISTILLRFNCKRYIMFDMSNVNIMNFGRMMYLSNNFLSLDLGSNQENVSLYSYHNYFFCIKYF